GRRSRAADRSATLAQMLAGDSSGSARSGEALTLHHVLRAENVRLSPAHTDHADGFSRCALVDRTAGSVAVGFGRWALEAGGGLEAGGEVQLHVHSFEESFYVLEGAPTLVLEIRGYRLGPGACGVVPIGVPHAWLEGDGEEARWLEMLAPQPREPGRPADTF